MNEVEEVTIENLIYEIRGKQVMLDRDLAKLYQCKNGTKTINLAVKRHINRFLERFMFQLTKEESSRFQTETLNRTKRGSNVKYLTYVFTEQGVAKLATVLKSNVAEKISVSIMDSFVVMRKYISSNLIEQKYINEMVLIHDKDIKLLQESFNKFEEKRKINEIYFEGQIYDAYSKILDIMYEAKSELIIVDGYADKNVLDMLKNVKVKIKLIVKTNGLLTKLDIEKYNKQYSNLEIKYTNIFHDRYFIIDNNKFYHCGASINKIGNKVFSINILEDEIVKDLLLDKVSKL